MRMKGKWRAEKRWLLPPHSKALRADSTANSPKVKSIGLEQRHRDHGLAGNWNGHRECHLKPDLLLIYKKPGDQTLRLVRMGSHSQLFAK